ncbi:class I SAM-dependent methyltransferase [Methanosarcina sp. 1.H.A.2.2]|uniref:class I SAM-dependent methyltransferase n=1 Tax=Methanosarcina sp. 1.H.A.2.2 TaxID=1483601 RepID=UPI0006226B64|nr:class I SAM-dependent methyltransferase [Methanosarcina sp. 1.H.A.2.2]KKH47216.1 hypothetical protein EO93_06245 [Methanosarcina sp. 1.H.A.2.2]
MKGCFNDLLIRIQLKTRYRTIDKIFSHLTSEEKITFISLARSSEGMFVEIGSYLGSSSCFIAEGIQQSEKKSHLFCIDTWQNDAMSEGNKDTYKEFLNNTREYKNIISPLRGWSYDVAENFDKKVDFIFIDGDHSYEGVKKDVDLWIPKLNPGALVVMHDIGWAEGVQRVVMEDIAPMAKCEGRLPNLYWARI